MQIGGFGSGFLGYGTGYDRRRAEAFKRGRKKGQKVRGTLIKRADDDTAWVDIEGHKLLAQIKTTAPPGSQLTFIIHQLAPVIILKPTMEPSQAGVTALNLASDFDTSRTLFENQFRSYIDEFVKIPTTQRKTSFVKALTGNSKLFETFADAINCIGNINQSIGNAKGRLSYTPWMVPSARRHIGLTRELSRMTSSTLEFDLPAIGMVQTEFLCHHDEIGYKIKLQHKARSSALQRHLAKHDKGLFAGKTQCLGVMQLPKKEHGGLLAKLIFGK